LELAGLSRDDLADARADARHSSLAFADRVAATDTFNEVVESFGENPDASAPLAARLHFMGQFASRYLDFRAGKSRAEMDKPPLTDRQEDALKKLGDETGMTGADHAFGVDADVYLVHGSYGPAIHQRLQRAKEHLDVQKLLYPNSQPIVVGASSDRAVTLRDRQRPISMAPYAQTEWGIMSGGFEYVLNARRRNYLSHDPNKRWYDLPNGSTGMTLSAPRIEGERGLANTADTQMYAAEVLGAGALIGAKVVGVTTQVYSLFQEADLRRKWGLNYGARVQMAGFHDAEMTQPHHIGAEFKAAIDHTNKLYKAILLDQTKQWSKHHERSSIN
jgi:hypothetical protein